MYREERKGGCGGEGRKKRNIDYISDLYNHHPCTFTTHAIGDIVRCDIDDIDARSYSTDVNLAETSQKVDEGPDV